MAREIPPEVRRINELLLRDYGYTDSFEPIWRVVWSEDQFEKRLMDVTDAGITLMVPEVRLVPKYRQWIPEKWVLEQLVAVPDMQMGELPAAKLSYEPMLPFEDSKGNALPPHYGACKFVIDSLNATRGKGNLAKYKEPSNQETLEQKMKEADELVEAIFGNETDVSDAVTRGEGVFVPNSYKGVN